MFFWLLSGKSEGFVWCCTLQITVSYPTAVNGVESVARAGGLV